MNRTIVGMVMLAVLAVPAGAQERNVLVEMFTNSHCVLCPAAHASLKSYATSSPNAARIRYIYYHVPFPYQDDPLAQVTLTDAAGRNQYYGPFAATPVTFFDGTNQGTSYGSWESALNTRVGTASPLKMSLAGSRNGDLVSVIATIEAVGTLPAGAMSLHFVIVENVNYMGRNGVTPQDFVMRKMVAGPAGEALTIANGQTKIVEKTTVLSNVSIKENAGMIVFVQETSTKAILQSEYLPYGTLTGFDSEREPVSFRIGQNYPNPFNPQTRIEYAISFAGNVRLSVSDLLGREVAVLVNAKKEAGIHSVVFDGTGLSSGVYLYRLTAGNLVQTRRMLLLR